MTTTYLLATASYIGGGGGSRASRRRPATTLSTDRTGCIRSVLGSTRGGMSGRIILGKFVARAYGRSKHHYFMVKGSRGASMHIRTGNGVNKFGHRLVNSRIVVGKVLHRGHLAGRCVSRTRRRLGRGRKGTRNGNRAYSTRVGGVRDVHR